MLAESSTFSNYHSALRILVVVFALVLIFDSGLLFQSTAQISTLTQAHLANVVGVKVGVAPNELNLLTARITELERDLEFKEREIAANANQNQTSGFDTSTFILSLILFILLVLIVLNYVLDYLRTRPLPANNSREWSGNI